MTPPTFRRAALAVVLATILSGAAHAQAADPRGAGLDRAGMDPSVRPQDDLFAAMNGTWIKSTGIPADRPSWGAFNQLRDTADRRVRDLVDGLQDTHPAAGSNAQKVNDYYRSFLDTAAIDKAGLAPVLPSLKEIERVRDADMLVALMARWQGVVRGPLEVYIAPDLDDPTACVAELSQAGLGLPDRDYYLKADERFAGARAAYTDYLATLFTLAGATPADATTQAVQVIALETKIAAGQWSRERNRDPVATHNPMPLAALAALAPGMNWALFKKQAQLRPDDTMIVSQPSYVAALAALLQSEPLDAWKFYLEAARLDDAARVLPAAFRDARYRFRDVALSGARQERPRWQVGVASTNSALGEAVGQLYVARHFTPEAKVRVLAIVDNLLRSFAQSIDGVAWMSPDTKAEARRKLSKLGVKVGYPDTWRDYAALVVKPGDALGNADRADAFEYRRSVARAGRRVDRTEWGMTPQTVNAYYDPSRNEIVFPAAILQPPFFDVAADDAVNYGAVGAMIGHQVSDGFDDMGGRFDGDGRLRDWWTTTDRRAFQAATSRLVGQYDAYSPVPGQHVNGHLTLNENIADLAGLEVAYKAWKLSLDGQPAAVIDGFTGEQRFVYGFAQVWREKTRDERARQLLLIDPHAPGRFRADGTAINADVFHDAFHTKPGDGMWKAPQDRVHVW